MAKSLAYELGYAAYQNSPDEIDAHCLTNSPRKEQLIENWGNSIIVDLRLKGIYLNQVRGDPSGRW